jgi:hypothetical protein
MPVSFRELLDTFELISATSGVAEYQAIMCRQTGKIYCHSDFPDFEPFNDELPDDFENEEKYIALPDRRELDLGKPLMLDFAREFLPDDFDEVRRIFGKRGAYQNFKRLLARRNVVDQWYKFEAEATERALRDWCEVNGIAVTD